MEKNSRGIVRRLGRTGFDVNVIGLGGHTYPVGHEPDCFVSPDARAQLIQYLVSSGVNYFDTTWIEEVELLADSFRRAAIKKDVLISLHGGAIREQQWRQKLRQGIESRLDILGFTAAPLFIVNVGEGDVTYAEVFSACQAMKRLKEEKVVRNIGLSCHTISLFPLISRVIRETDMIDYIMIRFNWKFQQAAEELFPVAEKHDVGIVFMKIFCWDCAPAQWERKISVFEPIPLENHITENSLTPAQRNILWCIQNSYCDVIVPSMNAMRETKENIDALKFIDVKFKIDDFKKYGKRLWDKKEVKSLALYAESSEIRNRARVILNPRGNRLKLIIRTIRAHYRILRNEGLRKYLQYSYCYRKEQLFNRTRKIRL
jgi:predicted aldo/keto reductase-like oxidoreductase